MRSDWPAGARDERIDGDESLSDTELRFVPFVRQPLGGANAADVILLDNVTASFADANGQRRIESRLAPVWRQRRRLVSH